MISLTGRGAVIGVMVAAAIGMAAGFGTVRAETSAEAAAGQADETNYMALAARIEGTLRQALYAEDAFVHPRTQMMLLDLRKAAMGGGGREAFLATARRHYDRLPFSHFSVIPPRSASADQASGTSRGDKAETVTLEMREDGIAVLTIRSWGVSLEDMKSVFERIDEQKPGALIVDLRENNGGTYSSGYLAAHLLSEPATSGALFGRPARERILSGDWSSFPVVPVNDIRSVDHLSGIIQESGAFIFAFEPLLPRYDGPVHVLSSHVTASANEPLIANLKAMGRITVVGEPTAGEMLSGARIDVGQGWRIFVPVFDYVMLDLSRLDLRGVAPDVLVPADQALDKAVELIAAQAG